MRLIEQIHIGKNEFQKSRGHKPSYLYLNQDTFKKLVEELDPSLIGSAETSKNVVSGLEVIIDEFLEDDTFLFSRVRFLDVLRSVK